MLMVSLLTLFLTLVFIQSPTGESMHTNLKMASYCVHSEVHASLRTTDVVLSIQKNLAKCDGPVLKKLADQQAFQTTADNSGCCDRLLSGQSRKVHATLTYPDVSPISNN
jgi:hypothetical protein